MSFGLRKQGVAGLAKRHRASVVVVLGLIGVLLAGIVVSWSLYRSSGYSPGELLDYVERRLDGHPRLESWASSALGALRAGLGASRASDRLRLPFLVPPPPPRRGPGEVVPADPPPHGARVWRVGPRGGLARIEDAARQAKDGDVVEIEAGDYRGDVAVWEQKRLTIRGVNGAARLFADGRSAEGKAIWVIRDGDFDISNIDFVNAAVDDGNGAGIRFEGGNLRVRNCLFWGNQMGLLAGGAGLASTATLLIRDSEFAYSHVDGRWGHNLYVGAIAEFTLMGSYSHHAARGHLVKSRARVSQVLYNRLTDESGGRASYELNFPNGGLVRVMGNLIQQQPETDNSTMIAYGEEGYTWPINRLAVASNSLVNDLRHGGAFIRVAPGVGSVTSANNLLVGPGVMRIDGPWHAWNDVHGEWDSLVRPSRQDYRLRQVGPRFAYMTPSVPTEPGNLVPTARYAHPRSVVALPAPPALVGAIPLVLPELP